jgi:chromosome segregation ATPase
MSKKVLELLVTTQTDIIKRLTEENERLKETTIVIPRETSTPTSMDLNSQYIKRLKEENSELLEESAEFYEETVKLKAELEIAKAHRDEEYNSNVGLESHVEDLTDLNAGFCLQIEDLTESLSDVHEDLRKSVIEKRSLKKQVKELESDLKAIEFLKILDESIIDYQHDEIKLLEGKISSLEGSDYNSEVNVLKRENYALRGHIQDLQVYYGEGEDKSDDTYIYM